jgi:hypothetical protein
MDRGFSVFRSFFLPVPLLFDGAAELPRSVWRAMRHSAVGCGTGLADVVLTDRT